MAVGGIPPWIAAIDPIAPVPLFLRGFGQGAQVGESLRQSEQRAAAEAQNAAQFNAELSARQQRAQQDYEFKAAEQQEKVKAAARHLIGMQKFQSLIQAGVPKITAMVEASADLFYDRPHELPNAMHQLAQEEAEVKRAEALENYRNKSLKLREDQANKKNEPVELELRDVPGFGVALVNPKTGSVHVRPPAKNIDDVIDNAQASAAARLMWSPDATDEDKEKAQTAINDIRTKRKQKASEPTTPKIPAVGEVQKGYRFKGGDPSKPESWEKVE